jgi:hypothetical protein
MNRVSKEETNVSPPKSYNVGLIAVSHIRCTEKVRRSLPGMLELYKKLAAQS